jgi:ketosteroid isomerase-like protein
VPDYPRPMAPGSTPHRRDEVEAAVNRYHRARQRIDEGLEPNGFGALADFYTEHAVYVDAAWGRIEGRGAIAHWLEHSMIGLGDWKFPVEFTAIEGNDVVVKWTQIIPGRRADGTPYSQSAYSRLRYAGGGRFDYQEDTYNMVHVLEDIAASGWRPTEPMNVPPEHPVRNWAPPG